MLHNDVVLYRRTITFSYVVSTNHKSPRLHNHPYRCVRHRANRRLHAAHRHVPQGHGGGCRGGGDLLVEGELFVCFPQLRGPPDNFIFS